jgi:hypothetical protein
MIEEVKAQLMAAFRIIEEGQELIHAASEKMGDARVTMMGATAGSGNDLIGVGSELLGGVADKLSEATQIAQGAKERIENYIAVL